MAVVEELHFGRAASIGARTFFSAVHGVISVSLEGRFAGITPELLEREVTVLTRLLAHNSS
ncbi:hypothetical protein J2Z19_005823 [Ensifer adhaerens]|uniref:Uncharacterized protein n=1 Tax=Ensifer adhaerens TaxID=106592 RepID=A0ACC5T5Z4_ENSAD|nr:hypothetical protein [Ensifer adhaerens]MBP1876074.1 hypothetical protein [Ensifer adhaerens]